MVQVEKITECPTVFGEGPHWDVTTQALYFVDLYEQTINKYVPSTKKHTKATIGQHVSFIIPVKGKKDQFLISYGRSIVLITWNGEDEKVTIDQKLYEVEKDMPNNVFNDAKCDPLGRLWTGTMAISGRTLVPIPKGKGSFYSFQNKKVITHFGDVGISNGIAFNAELKKMYYIDSYTGTLDQFDINIENGTITNRVPVFTLKTTGNDGIMDGMTIDTDGNLFVAVFGGSKVLKIDPRKADTLLETISIPGLQVTSTTFGGPNMDELFVTTGKVNFEAMMSDNPADGAIYKITGLNAKGVDGLQAVL